MDTSQGCGVQLVKGVVLLAEEHVELVGRVEGKVEVEDDEAETTAVTIAIGLHIVLRIVCTAQIHLCCHIIDELVDIQHPAYLLVGLGIGGIGREHVNQFVVGIRRAAFLYVARVGRHLKLVYLVLIPSVVGIDIVLVVGLAHVEHTYITAIDELVYGLVALTVEVDAGTLQYHLDGGILETGIGIVTAITDLQGTVADIRFLFEEGVGQVLLIPHLLTAFQLERMRCEGTAPATTHLQVHILVEHHIAIAVEE